MALKHALLTRGTHRKEYKKDSDFIEVALLNVLVLSSVSVDSD